MAFQLQRTPSQSLELLAYDSFRLALGILKNFLSRDYYINIDVDSSWISL